MALGGHRVEPCVCPLLTESGHRRLHRHASSSTVSSSGIMGGTVRMAEARVERRLAAILAADVAGYSRLVGVDEEGTLAALKAYRRELIDPKIAEHRGRIVKTTGDGALVEFASAVDAVRCAMEIQRRHGRAKRCHSTRSPDECRLLVPPAAVPSTATAPGAHNYSSMVDAIVCIVLSTSTRPSSSRAGSIASVTLRRSRPSRIRLTSRSRETGDQNAHAELLHSATSLSSDTRRCAAS